MSTVRFSQLVEEAGRPAVHALWTAPEQDRAFQAAVRSCRVVTVTPGKGKADAAEVGFIPGGGGRQYLVFPRSVKHFEGRRVVGVKFDLVEQPTAIAARAQDIWEGVGRKRRAAAKPPPATRRQPAPRENPSKQEAEPAPRPAPQEGPAARPAVALVSGRLGPGRRRQPPQPRGQLPRRPAARSASMPAGRKGLDALRGEVVAALQELRDGKTVAAFQRLEQALANLPAE